MRTLRLARAAAEAEGLVLRRHVRRAVIRGMLGTVALVFLLSALAMLHVAAWLRLSPSWGAEETALALAGFDIVAAAFVALLAARTPPDAVMAEAARLRDKAIGEIRGTLNISLLLRPLIAVLVEQWRARQQRGKE